MGHSHASNRVHVIFSTKDRNRCLTAELQPRLWAYMAGVAQKQGFTALIIGGVEDHVHALIALPPTMPLSKAIQFLKGSSSKWINDDKASGGDFAWQEGYGAFSISASHTADVYRYIRNQKEHHARKTLEDEFSSCLKKYGIEFDPEHVFG